MSLLLYILSRVLGFIALPIGFIYAIFRPNLKDYFFINAVSFDQFGNTVMCRLFNDILIKSSEDLFGDEDETISSVLGKNQVNGTLRPLGKGLVWILDKIEKDHSIKSIEE